MLPKAIELNPGHHASYVDLAHVYFLKNEYLKAWPLYEHRLDCFPPALKFRRVYPDLKRWTGQPLQGKRLAVYCEQGLGDFINFFRFVPNLMKQGARICLHTHKSMISLMQQNIDAEIKEVFLPEEYDYHCSIASLPFLGSVLWENPYIKCDKKANLKEYPQFKIGIAWAGNPQHPSDRIRSCNLQYFKPIHDLPNVKLFNLQKEIKPRQYAGEGKKIDLTDNCDGMHIVDLSEWINNFEDTAAFVNEMDLIITVDTALLHLAGALGKKTWALLPFNPDWRWGIEGNETFWYPSVKLYRQESPNNWESVFEKIREDLCK